MFAERAYAEQAYAKQESVKQELFSKSTVNYEVSNVNMAICWTHPKEAQPKDLPPNPTIYLSFS